MKTHTFRSNRRSFFNLVLGASLLAFGQLGCGRNDDPAPRKVAVAAASDLRYALDAIIHSFAEAEPDIAVAVTYGSSGNLFAQLSSGAPFDLFLSADMEYPRQLIRAGLAREDSQFLYAIGHLVLWVPKDSPLDEKRGMEILLDPAVTKIAFANPQFAPYGRAAKAALESLGLLDKVKDRLVLGDSVAQVAQFVESGGAEVGILALSLARAPALADKGRFWQIPDDKFPKLEQGGVILAAAKDPDAALAFRRFLMGDTGRTILEQFGFEAPK